MPLPDALTRRLREVAEGDPTVRALYAFGSRAQDPTDLDADLDIGVLFTGSQPLKTTLRLEETTRRATGEIVDVVDVARVGAFLALAIVRGDRLFARDPDLVDRFELDVLRRAGDLLPFERARRATITPGTINRALVAGKAALVRRWLDAVYTLPLADLDAFTREPHVVAAGESYLRRMLDAVLDIARHVLARGFALGPAGYDEVARQLGEVGVVSPAQAERLVRMARYRNRVVHLYDEVTAAELYELLTSRLAEVGEVVGAIVAWVSEHPDRAAAED